MSSILGDIKEQLGLGADAVGYDAELILFINAVLADFNQLGVGPDRGFAVTGMDEEWETFLGNDLLLNAGKSLAFLQVKMLFDPPQVGYVLTAYEKLIEKAEWRLTVAADSNTSVGSDGLQLVAGSPFAQTIRVKAIRNVWPTVDLLEVRAQLRAGKSTTDRLLSNLHTYMTWAYDVDDLVITLSMTGAQTRELAGMVWGENRRGYFNIIISDVGTTDSRAIVVPLITMTAVSTTVTASGAV